MRNYHILYKEKEADLRTKGFNIKAETIISAIIEFERQYNKAHIVYVQDKGKENTSFLFDQKIQEKHKGFYQDR